MLTRIIWLSLAVVVMLPFAADSQTVASGYQLLAEDVYAFSAEGSDNGFVAGCELGNDVRIIASKNFTDIEEYSAIEQLKLLSSTDTPSFVTAGFGVDGTPTALLLGISSDTESWPVFHQLILAKDKISIVSYPTSLIAGVLEEPGAWAELCPFFSRQETLEGFSSLYQTSYVFARPDGTFAGYMWRENGLWLVTFIEGKIAVDRVYAPAEGNVLAPVWSVACSRAGKVAAAVYEINSIKESPDSTTSEDKETLTVPEQTETESAETTSAFSRNDDSDTGVGISDEETHNTSTEYKIESSVLSSNYPSESLMTTSESILQEEPPSEENDNGGMEPPVVEEPVEEGADENPAATETAPISDTAAAVDEQEGIQSIQGKDAKIVLVSNYNTKTWAIDIETSVTPLTLSLGLAVDGRPFVVWTTLDKEKGKLAYYWGIKHTDPSKVVPIKISSSLKSALPFAALRTTGLPVIAYEENGKVLLGLNNGSSSEWVYQEAYTLTDRLVGIDAVMGLKTTAYFILDGESLFWHWHQSK